MNILIIDPHKHDDVIAGAKNRIANFNLDEWVEATYQKAQRFNAVIKKMAEAREVEKERMKEQGEVPTTHTYDEMIKSNFKQVKERLVSDEEKAKQQEAFKVEPPTLDEKKRHDLKTLKHERSQEIIKRERCKLCMKEPLSFNQQTNFIIHDVLRAIQYSLGNLQEYHSFRTFIGPYRFILRALNGYTDNDRHRFSFFDKSNFGVNITFSAKDRDVNIYNLMSDVIKGNLIRATKLIQPETLRTDNQFTVFGAKLNLPKGYKGTVRLILDLKNNWLHVKLELPKESGLENIDRMFPLDRNIKSVIIAVLSAIEPYNKDRFKDVVFALLLSIVNPRQLVLDAYSRKRNEEITKQREEELHQSLKPFTEDDVIEIDLKPIVKKAKSFFDAVTTVVTERSKPKHRVLQQNVVVNKCDVVLPEIDTEENFLEVLEKVCEENAIRFFYYQETRYSLDGIPSKCFTVFKFSTSIGSKVSEVSFGTFEIEAGIPKNIPSEKAKWLDGEDKKELRATLRRHLLALVDTRSTIL